MHLSSATCCLILLVSNAFAEDRIPEWFQKNPAQAQHLFEAWKNLTTREAALYTSPTLTGWYVAAGVLLDEKGVPIANCPLVVLYVNFKGYSARLQTDGNGHFLIYSPFAKPSADDKSQMFHACPGYPYSPQGLQFAYARRDLQLCSLEVEYLSDEHCFCTLTCRRQNTFNQRDFEEFQQDELRRFEQRAPKVWRHPPKPPEAPSVDVLQTRYRLRLVSPQGAPIPDARVIFNTEHQFGVPNHQVAKTDAHGECILDERLPATLPSERRERVARYVSIDAGGFGVGPRTGQLKPDELNVIRMREPASICGRLVGHRGQSVRTDLTVQYKALCLCTSELRAEIAPDGSFEFNRIISGEEFKLVSTRAETEWLMLRPGESKSDVTLTIPLAAALRVLVVDGDGNPLKAPSELSIQNDGSAGWRFLNTASDGRLSASSLKPGVLRARVEARGFRPSVSDELTLEPGELRFIRMQLEPHPGR